jgi:uncharacterized membrane-anchored protein
MRTNGLSTHWSRFWIPLVLQLILILAIPAQAVYTNVVGQTIWLQTAPVDPYSLLTGYSQTLSYEISQVNRLKQLPGWGQISQNDALVPGSTFYVILQQGKQRETPWGAVALSLERPTQLPNNQVGLRASVGGYNQIRYGLETYYIPEDKKDEVNQLLQQRQRQQPALVEAKVDHRGHAIPISIKVGQLRFKY